MDIRTKRVNKERAKMVVSPSIKRAIWGKHNSSYPVVYFGPKRFLLLSLFISFGCDNVKEYLIRSGTQGCALTAPGRLRRLTFSFGRLKKSSRSPGRALLLLVECSVKRAEKFNLIALAC